MGAQRAPINSMKLLWCGPWEHITPLVSRGPTEPSYSVYPAHLSPGQKVTGSHPAVKAGCGQHQPRTQAGSVTVSDGDCLKRTRAYPRYGRQVGPSSAAWGVSRTGVSARQTLGARRRVACCAALTLDGGLPRKETGICRREVAMRMWPGAMRQA